MDVRGWYTHCLDISQRRCRPTRKSRRRTDPDWTSCPALSERRASLVVWFYCGVHYWTLVGGVLQCSPLNLE